MPTELGLIDGTKLRFADDNIRPDDALNKIRQPVSGFVSITTAEGDYRINPAHVVYVRWVDDLVPLVG